MCPLIVSDGGSTMHKFVENMKSLKKEVIQLEKDKNIEVKARASGYWGGVCYLFKNYATCIFLGLVKDQLEN